MKALIFPCAGFVCWVVVCVSSSKAPCAEAGLEGREVLVEAEEGEEEVEERARAFWVHEGAVM
jgi:hypothetical protein